MSAWIGPEFRLRGTAKFWRGRRDCDAQCFGHFKEGLYFPRVGPGVDAQVFATNGDELLCMQRVADDGSVIIVVTAWDREAGFLSFRRPYLDESLASDEDPGPGSVQ